MDVFAVLADPVRRDLLRTLARGPARVVDLAADHPISRPAVSKHLRLLAGAGLVTAADRGRERHYGLRPEALAPVTDLLVELQPRPPFGADVLDGLDLEVRRTVRETRRETPRDLRRGSATGTAVTDPHQTDPHQTGPHQTGPHQTGPHEEDIA